MNVTHDILENRIKDMFPELAANGMGVEAEMEDATGDWLVHIGRDGDRIATHVGAADAAACLDGGRCLNLAAQVGNFVNDRCGSTTACML